MCFISLIFHGCLAFLGIFDAMGNIYKGVAKALREEKSYKGEFPTLYEGVRGMLFIEKTVESNQKGNVWVSMENQ